MQDFMNDDDRLALSKFESMLQSNKVYFFDSEEFEEIVYYYMDSGKMNLANKAIELSLLQHPTSIPLKLIKVELLIFENKFKIAERLLANIENTDPTFDEIYIQKASILSKNDNHQGAILELQKALTLTNDIIDVNSLLGMEYLFIEDFISARKCFEICLNEDIEDYAALYNIIYCFDMLDDGITAINFLNEYINNNPYSEVAWHQLGRQYISAKQYNEAIRAFDYAILIDEYFIGAYLEKAKVLENQQNYEAAISNYMLTLKLDDPTAYTYLQIAICYEHLNNSKQALKYYHKSIIEDPMLDKAWLLVTNLYIKNDNPQKALYFIQKALEVDADNYDYLNRFAEINIQLNLFEEASKAFQKSITLGDKRLELFLALADIMHFIGDYNDSLEVLNQALHYYPKSAEIFYRLSGIHYLLRKDNDALRYFEKGLELDFSYHNIIEDIFPEIFNKVAIKSLIAKFIADE